MPYINSRDNDVLSSDGTSYLFLWTVRLFIVRMSNEKEETVFYALKLPLIFKVSHIYKPSVLFVGHRQTV